MRVVPATLEHALAFAPRLRKADVRELVSSTGQPPVEVLAAALGASASAWAVLEDDGTPVLLWGVSARGQVGIPWMVATPAVLRHGRKLARLTRPFVDAMQEHYPVLTNYADCRNTLHLRWLAWAGFTFTRVTTDFAADGSPFVEFIRIKNHVRSRHSPHGCIDGPFHRRGGLPVLPAEADGQAEHGQLSAGV